MSLKRAMYPLLGALIIGGYTFTVMRGYDPASVQSSKRVAPEGARAARGHMGSRPRSTFIWFGGFGGK